MKGDRVKQMFEEDWKLLPRMEGNKRKALECYRATVGVNPTKRRPEFQAKVALYCRATRWKDRQFIKNGETFIRNWRDLEIIDPDAKAQPPKQKRKRPEPPPKDLVPREDLRKLVKDFNLKLKGTP